MPRKKQRQVTAAPAPLDGLQAANDWVEGRGKAIFGSDGSWRWFLFRYKPRLVKAGALLEIAGSFFVDEPLMLRELREIGAETIQHRIEARFTAEASSK